MAALAPAGNTGNPGGARAGLLTTSRALRSLNQGGLVDANLQLKSRQRGFTEGQMIESLVLLQTLGGDCPGEAGRLTRMARSRIFRRWFVAIDPNLRGPSPKQASLPRSGFFIGDK